jgi:hypothetical protein
MAAFLTDRLLSPHAVPAVAAFSPTPRVTRRRSIDRTFCDAHDSVTRERRMAAALDACRDFFLRPHCRWSYEKTPPRSGRSRFCHHAQ